MSKPVHLAINNYTVYKNQLPLFKPITGLFQGGSLIHIRGKNGIGKTSFLKSLMGIGKVTYHELQLNHEVYDLNHYALALKPHLFYHPQEHPYEPYLTVKEFINLWEDFYHCHYSESLPFESSLHLKQLSYGQRQQLFLIKLGLSKAPIWLLDEPFNFLDSTAKTILSHQINQHLVHQGLCFVVTHEVAFPNAFHLDLIND